MSSYEILFLGRRGEASVHYWPSCGHDSEARQLARQFVLPRFAAAEVWRDSERIDLVVTGPRAAEEPRVR